LRTAGLAEIISITGICVCVAVKSDFEAHNIGCSLPNSFLFPVNCGAVSQP
jgi:hypothetical protein